MKKTRILFIRSESRLAVGVSFKVRRVYTKHHRVFRLGAIWNRKKYKWALDWCSTDKDIDLMLRSEEHTCVRRPLCPTWELEAEHIPRQSRMQLCGVEADPVFLRCSGNVEGMWICTKCLLQLERWVYCLENAHVKQ